MATPGAVLTSDRRSATRRAFANRTFAVSYVAEAQSIFGDQLARVALAVLVFRLTGSTPATAASYAATFLPAIAGGVLLGRLGDRLSRRSVMVGCDVARACCFAVIAIKPDAIVAVILLVILAVTLGPAFSAAQLGLLAARLDLEEFTAGNAVRLVTSQAAQVAGFAVGGVIVAALDPAGALAINAVTFTLSAIALQVLIPTEQATVQAAESGGAVALAVPDHGLHDASNASDASGASDDGVPDGAAAADQKAPDADDAGGPGTAAPAFAGLWRDRAARRLVLLSICVGFFVVPEGLAVPFAEGMGAGSKQAGLLLASGALGGALGAALLMKLNAASRTRWANSMAVLCGVPLVLSALLAPATTQWWPIAVCWLASGALAAYVVQPTSVLVHSIPDAFRSRSVGVLSALLLGSQGLAVSAFGGIAAATSPIAAVGLAGAAGCAVTLLVTTLGRAPRHRSRHALTA